MSIGQAAAIACGLSFVILGGLYVVFRSGLAAQRLFSSALLLTAATFVLIHPFPNLFIAAGVATAASGQALRAFGLKPWALQIKWSANVLAGLLCAAGFGIHADPIRIFGVTISLFFSTSSLWVLLMIRRAYTRT